MSPTIRSRLWASWTAFFLGFAAAISGTALISRPDQRLWMVLGAVLMATGIAGVLFADSTRRTSLWAVLGVELFVVFTVVPLVWAFSVATAPADEIRRSLWPETVTWEAFSDAWSSDLLRHAAQTSVVVAGLATLVALPLGLAAAHALTRLEAPGRRWVYGGVVAVLLAPTVTLAGPVYDQLLALGLTDVRLAQVGPALLVALPLTTWLGVTVWSRVPWQVFDSARADGATRLQVLRRVGLPLLGPGVLVTALVVFVVTSQDAVMGAAIAADDASRPLPATLAVAAGRFETPSATVVAVGLMWALPAVLVLLVFPRRIADLLGRAPR